jgi:hypothetical protein
MDLNIFSVIGFLPITSSSTEKKYIYIYIKFFPDIYKNTEPSDNLGCQGEIYIYLKTEQAFKPIPSLR